MRAGSASRPSARSDDTRRALVEAAIEVLRERGFAAATARIIATAAGCNQGLIFYHFGSVVNLLLAALDEVSARRRQRYESFLAGVRDLDQLVGLGVEIFREDLDSGDAAVLVEMIAGASSTPGLGAEVKARMAPWTQFAAGAIETVLGPSPLAGLAPAEELAHAIVALYLGLELISHLDGDRGPAIALFERIRRIAPLFGGITGGGSLGAVEASSDSRTGNREGG